MSAKHYDTIVIGGGPAGMVAALTAAERGRTTLLIEKNAAPGKKLDITGGGRCNITNAEFDARAFLTHYGESAKFLASPFSRFGVRDAFEFFEKRGLPLVVQGGKRAFPASEKAPDVTKLLHAAIKSAGVELLCRTPVTGLDIAEGSVRAVRTPRGQYSADSFILATGGLSRPETGSSGEGLSWLASAGHAVKKPTPNIVPLKVTESWAKKLAGTTLSDIRIVFFCEGKKALVKDGRLLFTHFGISGPLILNSAAAVAELMEGGAVTAALDLFPRDDLGSLEKKVIAEIDSNKNKGVANALSPLLPPGMPRAVFSLLGKDAAEGKAHSFSREDRKKLVRLLKAMPLTIEGLMGFDRAVISDGGVSLKEVDTRTMRSLKIANLFLVGDVLDVRRPSGGYSLQLCWATGFVAGSAA